MYFNIVCLLIERAVYYFERLIGRVFFFLGICCERLSTTKVVNIMIIRKSIFIEKISTFFNYRVFYC